MSFLSYLESLMCEHDYVYIGKGNNGLPFWGLNFGKNHIYRCKTCNHKIKDSYE